MNTRQSLGTLALTLILASCGQQVTDGSTDRQAPDLSAQVINGTTSQAGARPYQVALLNNGRQFCGGTLISDQWVLTAAHCVDGSSTYGMSVRLGSLYTNRGGVTRRISTIKVHPNYRSVTQGYDVAVMKLSSPVSFGSSIKAAALPTPAFAAQAAAAGTVQVISGWGMTRGGDRNSGSSYLREAALPVISNQACGQQLNQYITDGMICGNKNNSGQTGCHGDSGGPFASKHGNKYFVFGVVSWGTPSVCNKATAFARVGEYQPWITRMTGVQPNSGNSGGNPGDPGNPSEPNIRQWKGTLEWRGAYQVLPGMSGFNFAGGRLVGKLTHSYGKDFDLYLQKKQGYRWEYVAQSTSSGSSEKITYNGQSGTYRWIVHSYQGTGDYILTSTK